MWKNVFHVILMWHGDILRIFYPCHQNIPNMFVPTHMLMLTSSCSCSHVRFLTLLDFGQFLLFFLCQWFIAHWLFLVTLRPQLPLTLFVLIIAFVHIVQVSLIFLGDLAFGFTFGAWRAFILHALTIFINPWQVSKTSSL
jgi:hypothetical protein